MDIITFKIHRSVIGSFSWVVLHVWLFVVPLVVLIMDITIFNREFFSTENQAFFCFIVLFLLIPFPLLLSCFLRDEVIIQGDKLIIKTAFWPKRMFTFSIKTVSDVHYRRTTDGMYWSEWERFCVPLSKLEETISFQDEKKRRVSISTKDHKKLYVLLKEREILDYDDWGRVSKWK